MDWLLRTATPADYPAVADVMNATSANYPVTREMLVMADKRRDPLCKCGYLVGERDGRVVGFARYTQYIDLYHPRKFWVTVRVYPDYQRQGWGARLYDALLEAVHPFDPLALQTQISEDRKVGLDFARRRGFVEYHRRWSSLLEVATADINAWAEHEAKLLTDSIRLVSVADLAADPERDEKLRRLQWALDSDVPTADTITPLTPEQFQMQVLQHPRFLAAGTFAAVIDERYVGMSSFYDWDNGQLLIDLTGVLRNFRRRGIATGLKVKGIQFAQAQGYRQIHVTNDDGNDAILTLNQQLGFVRLPAEIQLHHEFPP